MDHPADDLLLNNSTNSSTISRNVTAVGNAGDGEVACVGSIHTHVSFAEHQRKRRGTTGVLAEQPDEGEGDSSCSSCSSSYSNSNTTPPAESSPAAASPASSSLVPADQERQILLLMLLAQVAAMHDPTPKTFTIHVLELFERGILDRQSIRFLYDLGLVPSASTTPTATPTRSLLMEDGAAAAAPDNDENGNTNATPATEANNGTMVAAANQHRHQYILSARSMEASAIRKTLQHHERQQQQQHSRQPDAHQQQQRPHLSPPPPPPLASSWSAEEHPLSLSRYQREFNERGLLASGSFGQVYCAENKMDGTEYAVKRVPFSANGYSKESVMQVVREVHCLAVCDHPNVVRYYTSWLEPSWMTGSTSTAAAAANFLENGSSVVSGNSGAAAKDDTTAATDYYGIDNNPIQRLTENLQHMVASGKRSEILTDDLKAYFSDPSFARRQRRSSMGDASFDYDDDSDACSVSTWGDQHNDVSEWTVDESMDDICVNGYHPRHSQRVNPSSRQEGKQAAGTAAAAAPNKSGPSYRYQICLFIQMQLCHPATLADWIRTRNQKIPAQSNLGKRLEVAAEIFTQITTGLSHVHQKGIVHRDLKPANVFASADGMHFKIGDFGLSKLIRIAGADKSCNRASGNSSSPMRKRGSSGRFNREEQFLLLENADETLQATPRRPQGGSEPSWRDPLTAGVGTASYAAPEQVATRDYGAGADIFSLGLILLELLCRFSTEHERLQTFADCRHRRSLPCEFDAYPVVSQTILACTEPKPTDRPTANDLQKLDLLKRGSCAAAPRQRDNEAPFVDQQHDDEVAMLKRRLAEMERELELSKQEMQTKDREIVDLRQQVETLREDRAVYRRPFQPAREDDAECDELAPSSSISSSSSSSNNNMDSDDGI